MLAKENAVFAVDDVVEGAAVAIGDDRATASESFYGGDAKRLEGGENVAFGVF